MTLSGANTYSGPTSVNAGTLQLGAANRVACHLGSHHSRRSRSLTSTISRRPSARSPARVLPAPGQWHALSGRGQRFDDLLGKSSAATGSVTKQGMGALTLSGANTYTGATTVSAGTLVASSATALGTTAGGVVVSNGATLNINNVAIGAEALTLNGAGVGGNGALIGTGTASLAGNAALATASSIGTPNAGDTLTLSGVISGANALTKLGAGNSDTLRC